MTYTKKREPKVQKRALKPWLVAGICLLLLGVLLLVAACGNYQNPGSPNATPTNGGYSIIYLIDKEMQVLPGH